MSIMFSNGSRDSIPPSRQWEAFIEVREINYTLLKNLAYEQVPNKFYQVLLIVSCEYCCANFLSISNIVSMESHFVVMLHCPSQDPPTPCYILLLTLLSVPTFVEGEIERVNLLQGFVES